MTFKPKGKMQNRNVYNADGKIVQHTQWECSTLIWQSWRLGYNFFDATWGAEPTDRLESIKSGSPSVLKTGDGVEVVLSHSSAPGPYQIQSVTLLEQVLGFIIDFYRCYNGLGLAKSCCWRK